ncbi:hypothetical protein QBC46DRAFT_415272 [Diplogelasinospora grovesii]|uniref:Zinc finger PHD-type domain-containing protein n=1 Tax=Diplogelasinospora grovesii TaxID=303347 RepID=A0AAN6S9R6_9PEZI|nr:hypothetical protein QBC46DRAFT_415272 [Diplogelasinospora grovesii]
MTGINRRTRKLPFLHRNWTAATNHWNAKMGNKASSQSRDAGDKFVGQDDQCQRAVKRRRLENKGLDGFPLFEGYGNTPRALRIEILKIIHKDSPRVKNGILNGLIAPNVRDMTQVKVRCKIMICGHKHGKEVVLHVDSQLCSINIFKNPAGSAPMARFSDIKPFHIPEDKILLERDDDAVFGLANIYTVLIELESAGDPNWPPVDLIPANALNDEDAFYSRGIPPRYWSLNANIPDLLNSRNRKTIKLSLKKSPDNDLLTNFHMDVDVRWYMPVSSQLTGAIKEKDILPSITVFDPFEPIQPPLVNVNLNGINGVNGHHEFQQIVNGELDRLVNGNVNGQLVTEQADDLAEGELTPSRSRRTRQEINYNVKQMWNTAIGKETRKRRRGDDEIFQPDEHTITYNLPPETVQTDRLGCLLCGAENERIAQLRAHYLSHPQYDFTFDHRAKGGCVVTVTPNPDYTGPSFRPTVYQLGLPVKPLDLEKYVDGDSSWITARLGPEDGRDLGQGDPGQKPQQPKTTQKPAPKRIQKKLLVPNIKQPLFEPLSKARLVPGTEIRQNPVVDSWLIQKHRDNIKDFVDVSPAEQEYMMAWDAFILRKHLSTTQYLPRVLLEFVKGRLPWFLAKRHRLVELSKHTSILLLQGAVGEAVVFELTGLLNDAQAQNPVVEPEPEPERQEAPRPNSTGCVACGNAVSVPSMLICANKQCNKRLYHKKCVEDSEEAEPKGQRWTCGTCSQK